MGTCLSQMPRELNRISIKSLEILDLGIGGCKRGGRALHYSGKVKQQR